MLAAARFDIWRFFPNALLDARSRRAEDIASAKRYVASPDFPQPAFVMPQDGQAVSP